MNGPDWTVVTGAGRGLGRALAVELAVRLAAGAAAGSPEAGSRVAALGRDLADLQETAALAAAAGAPGRVVPVLCDLADPAAVRTAFAALQAEAPVLRLVNNAALYPRRDILEETVESFMATVAVNLGGTLATVLAALPAMIAAGRGRIVNVSSFADVAPLPASAAYAVSKGAGRVLGRALQADLADRFPGIVISDWMPGMLATRIGVADGLDPAVAARWGAALALWDDPTLSGTIWEGDREIPPPVGLKRRLVNRLLGRRAVARRLPDPGPRAPGGVPAGVPAGVQTGAQTGAPGSVAGSAAEAKPGGG
ncbi:MAG: SDR family oxidoreductase [Paracoccaceae bacterium]